MPLGTEILSQNIYQYKAWFFQSSVSHLNVADEYLFQLTLQILLPWIFFLFYSKEFAHFYPFENKIFCKSIWDLQYMHVDFVLKVNAPLCPSAFPQSLKCIKVCYLRGWMPLLYHQIFIHILFKVFHRSIFSAARLNFQYSIRWLVVLYLFHTILPLLPIRRPALSWVRY